MRRRIASGCALALIVVVATAATAQSFRVQCPTSTITHPAGRQQFGTRIQWSDIHARNWSGDLHAATGTVNGAIKCQQISGGDGYATMGDGTQTYMFSFGPLSGLAKIANGQPGTDFPIRIQCPVHRRHTACSRRPGHSPGLRRPCSLTTARWAWCLTRTQ